MFSGKGILLVQLGSPEGLNLKKIGEYLYDFLGDPHTLGNPPPFWKLLLRFLIIPMSRKKSLAKYSRMFEANGFTEMPLVSISRSFLFRLRKELPNIPIELAYQYGCSPRLEESIQKFSALGVKEICVVPLYPQRSGVTSGAVFDQVKKAISKTSFQGQVLAADGFCYHKSWDREIAKSIQEKYSPSIPLVLSFHGVQEARIKQGDPYEKDCEASAKLIGDLLGVKPIIAYQSKYGKSKWIGPSLLSVLSELSSEHKKIVVATPAFTADNLETIYEIDEEAREYFESLGGKELVRVPCLNDSESWVKTFAHEILPELSYRPLE